MEGFALLLLENIKRVPAVFPQGLGVYGELKQGPALLVVKVEGQLPKGAVCLFGPNPYLAKGRGGQGDDLARLDLTGRTYRVWS